MSGLASDLKKLLIATGRSKTVIMAEVWGSDTKMKPWNTRGKKSRYSESQIGAIRGFKQITLSWIRANWNHLLIFCNTSKFTFALEICTPAELTSDASRIGNWPPLRLANSAEVSTRVSTANEISSASLRAETHGRLSQHEASMELGIRKLCHSKKKRNLLLLLWPSMISSGYNVKSANLTFSTLQVLEGLRALRCLHYTKFCSR